MQLAVDFSNPVRKRENPGGFLECYPRREYPIVAPLRQSPREAAGENTSKRQRETTSPARRNERARPDRFARSGDDGSGYALEEWRFGPKPEAARQAATTAFGAISTVAASADAGRSCPNPAIEASSNGTRSRRSRSNAGRSPFDHTKSRLAGRERHIKGSNRLHQAFER